MAARHTGQLWVGRKGMCESVLRITEPSQEKGRTGR